MYLPSGENLHKWLEALKSSEKFTIVQLHRRPDPEGFVAGTEIHSCKTNKPLLLIEEKQKRLTGYSKGISFH